MGNSISAGGYLLNLEEDLEALKSKTERVEAKRDNVLRCVIREEDRGRQRLKSVQDWLLKVQLWASKSRQLLNDAQVERNRLCLLGYCSSTNKYGKKVRSLLKEVESLESQALRFDDGVVAEQPIIFSSSPPWVFVGQERRLEELGQLVMEDEVQVIGVHGTGGVGKTTLVTQLYNRISVQEGHPPPFDNLFWIMVSTHVQVHRIQDNIGKQLALYDEEWEQKSKSQKAESIHTSLREKRFLMVLDDLWEKLDLESIGIPFPTRENGCKIIITSRSKEVCVCMGAEFFTVVQPLEEEQAWDLFQSKVGETTLQSHPDIPQLARRIAIKCHGLPLAIQVIGASMASQTSVQAWRHALDQLTGHVHDDSIYLCLKHGYDALERKQVKLCFLFFALFPEDEQVEKEYLIELWIGAGIIDENNNQDRAKGRGYEIIRILLARSLVMEAGESRDKLRMHDVLRELALYITSRTEIDKQDFIVESFTQVGRRSDIKNWREVSRVSLVEDDIKTLSGDFDCPKLRTLFLRDTRLETISPEFFSGMPLLLVLDLSSNQHLNILPDTISELVSLRYLNLSSTGIKILPLGLSKLKKLAYLYLEHTHLLKDITGISHIVNIQVLRLCDSGFHASRKVVEELQLLEKLELLTITLRDEDVVKQFLSCPKLAKCTQGFYLKYCAIVSSISFTSLSSSLRCLDVQDSYIPEMRIDKSSTGGDEAIIVLDAIPSDSFFTNLNEVRLDGCNGLRELTWLLFAPNLTKLRVMQSRDIEEIISKKKGANLNIVPFQKLEFLALQGLERLISIYWEPLPLPELREIRVRSCPGLTKLPLNSQSAKEHNLVLSAEKEWMKNVIKWEDEATKQRLFPS